MNSLYDAYLEGRPEVRNNFDKQPESLFSIRTDDSAWAPGAVQAVNELQGALGGCKGDLSGLEPVVVTGQQPGLFTGPLYTILKAVSAIQIARRLGSPDRSVIPLFWNASDDHDLVEVQTAHFLGLGEKVVSYTYTPDCNEVPHKDVSMFRVPLSPVLHHYIESAATACRNSGNAAEVRDFLHDSLNQSQSVSAWFSRLMAGLFRNTPLRIFEPHRESARRASLPVLRREIQCPLESTRLLVESGKQLAALGFDVPIKKDAASCNFFVEEDGRRRKVLYSNGRYILHGVERIWSVDEMLALLESEPRRFSPNVALRPVVQQLLFGPVAYVAGPGELAYWSQLKPLFSFFDLSMPIVYPRVRAMCVTGKLRKFLNEYHLDIPAVARNKDVLFHALKGTDGTLLIDTFRQQRPDIEGALESMAASLRNASSAPGLGKAVASFLAHSHFRLERLERAVFYADEESRRRVEGHLERLRNAFYPLGKPQERVFNVFSFLFREGFGLIDRMLNELDCTKSDLQEMDL